MQDPGGAGRPVAPPSVLPARTSRERRRVLIACAALVLLLHGAFFGQLGGIVPGAVESTVVPMSVRTLPDAPPVEAPAQATPAVAPGFVAPAPAALTAPPTARMSRRPREPAASASQPSAIDTEQASANSAVAIAAVEIATTSDAAPTPAAGAPPGAAAAQPPASPVADVGEAPVAAGASNAAGARPLLLAAGDEPPPVYRTQLPPPVALHYEVRRGLLRGTGTIRWQPSGDRYRLVLEAQVAGIALLRQTSEGGIDADGLAPIRFVDQRARRSAVAANFRRDDGRITFSGSAVEWPLLPGSQDRLSWMIQLASIAAAEPELLVDGGRIAMVVVGARGDAGVWTLRYAGRETIEAASGTVHAVKLVREGRSAYDTSAEIWLDPERSYLPVHATLRNSTGASEYDLLLERVDPG
jgi:hypothetical protein